MIKINEICFDKDDQFTYVLKLWKDAKTICFENCKFLNQFDESLDIQKSNLQEVIFTDSHIDLRIAEDIIQ